MKELWHATLDSKSPRYEDWKRILGTDRVPLMRPFSTHADLGPEKDVEIYLLDWQQLDEEQSSRLLAFLAQKFNVLEQEIENDLDCDGHFPIRAADVFVTFDMRIFL